MKFKFNLKTQILIGYGILIAIFLIYAGTNLYLSRDYEKNINKNTSVIQPSITALIEFNLLANESKNLTSHWISTELEDTKEKKALVYLHNKTYGKKKQELLDLVSNWDNKETKETIEKAITAYEKQVLKPQKQIMKSLNSFDDYNDIMIKMEIDGVYDGVVKNTVKVSEALQKVVIELKKENKVAISAIKASSETMSYISYILAALITFIGIILGVVIANRITRPVLKIKDTIDAMSKGLLPEYEQEQKNDEIGDISYSVKKLIENIRMTSTFAISIGEEKYETEFEKLSEGDVLGEALLDMRGKLRAAKDVESKTNWVSKGVAMFADILRENNDDIKILCDNVISNLVKYLGANQAGIFVINDDSKVSKMVLQASYAYDRKKFKEKEFLIGEGLVGQCWQENEKIFLTDIPTDYINITSGLGTANPTCIFIVPLIVNDEMYGVIEIASFKEIEDYQIDFIEKIAGSIASTISSVKVNLHTSSLLEESQQMSEEMQAQEEELRQNAEEMQATQEEMERKLLETEKNLKLEQEKVNSILRTSLEGVVLVSPDGKVKEHNPMFLNLFDYTSTEVIGQQLNTLLQLKEESIVFLAESAGKFVDIVVKLKNGNDLWVEASVNKLSDNEISDYSIFMTDITESKKRTSKLETELEEAKDALKQLNEIKKDNQNTNKDNG